jgi:hypothetical protein
MATYDPRPQSILSLFVGSPFFGETLLPPTPVNPVYLARTGENWSELPGLWEIDDE